MNQHVLEQAMALPAEDRARLAEKLLESLDVENQSEIDAAWLAEAERRAAAVESGQMGTIAADEVFRRLRDRNK